MRAARIPLSSNERVKKCETDLYSRTVPNSRRNVPRVAQASKRDDDPGLSLALLGVGAAHDDKCILRFTMRRGLLILTGLAILACHHETLPRASHGKPDVILVTI